MNTPVDIDALHEAMKTALAAQFVGTSVDFYPRPGDKITVPAILIDLDEISADDPDDIGTEQMPVTLNFHFYCVRSYKSGNKLAIRTFAASVMTFARGQRWSQPVGAAKVNGAFPDQFSADSKEYEVMRVELSHEALLGIDVWIDEGEVPTEVYLGEAPNIGPAHVADYTLIATAP